MTEIETLRAEVEQLRAEVDYLRNHLRVHSWDYPAMGAAPWPWAQVTLDAQTPEWAITRTTGVPGCAGPQPAQTWIVNPTA